LWRVADEFVLHLLVEQHVALSLSANAVVGVLARETHFCPGASGRSMLAAVDRWLRDALERGCIHGRKM